MRTTVETRSLGVMRLAVLGTTSLLGMAALTGCGDGGSTPAADTPPAETESTSQSTNQLPSDIAAVSPQIPSTTNPAENPAAASATPATIDTRPLLAYDANRPLVGSWLGVAHMDPDILQQRLAKASGEEQQELIQKAQTFRSFQMAIDLYNDGRMGGVVIGNINGQENVREFAGTWSVVQQEGNSFIVETVEANPEGEPNKAQVRMIVSEDHTQMVRPADIEERLLVCEPKFVFDRIDEKMMQQIANAQDAGQLK